MEGGGKRGNREGGNKRREGKKERNDPFISRMLFTKLFLKK